MQHRSDFIAFQRILSHFIAILSAFYRLKRLPTSPGVLKRLPTSPGVLKSARSQNFPKMR
jgi:hypothetical protein